MSCGRCGGELVQKADAVEFYKCSICQLMVVPYGVFFDVGEYVVHVANGITNIIKNNKIIKTYPVNISLSINEEELQIFMDSGTDIQSILQRYTS